MSLQARLRHSLGEQWFELPERGVDQPIVVGRAGTADLQVPSVAVAQRHCVLFVHDGRWVVQEVAGGAGTYVNGSKVDGAVFLSIGDVVTLGPDGASPAIEIDPAGALEGRAGQPTVAAAPAVSAASPGPSTAYASSYVAPQPVAPAAYAGNYPTDAAPAPAAEGAIAGWPADATPHSYTPRRRRRTSDGGSGVIIGMMLTLLITAGVGYWIYRHFGNRNPVVVAPAPGAQLSPASPVTRPAPDDPAGAPPSIFDQRQPRPAPPRATTRTGTAGGASAAPTPGGVVSPPAVGPGEMAGAGDVAPVDAAPSQDPPTDAAGDATVVAADDPAWKQVEAARHLKDEARAILQFDDYARTHPGTAADKIRQYTEKMLDRIWFERIENLSEQREELNRKIQEVDRELAEETDEAYKTRVLNPLREQYVIRLKNIEEELTQNMKYDGKDTPNLLDDAEIDRLREARDPQYYASWKNRVLAHIRRTHGELPWVATKSR